MIVTIRSTTLKMSSNRCIRDYRSRTKS